MKENLEKLVPHIMEDLVVMSEPNDSINLYSGVFVLKNAEINVALKGVIKYSWLPSPNIRFTGSGAVEGNRYFSYFDGSLETEIIIEDYVWGPVIITNLVRTATGDKGIVKGIFANSLVLGSNKNLLNRLRFSLANMKEFGNTLARAPGRKKEFGRASGKKAEITGWFRTKIENDTLSIKIDQRETFKDHLERLKNNGGFHILYNGEIQFKKPVEYEIATDYSWGLGLFLSFLNGRRVHPIFVEGFKNLKKKISEFPLAINEPYQSVISWSLPVMSFDATNNLWSNFFKIWTNKESKEFLVFSIKWYCEANAPELSSDTRLIMAQTTLELIFNWWLVEKNKLIQGKDSRNLMASNKIRLLLSSCSIMSKIPVYFPELINTVHGLQSNDGPEAIVTVRNALVHSRQANREKINKIGNTARFQALRLALYYIEICMMRILQFNGNFVNRCDHKVYPTPWST